MAAQPSKNSKGSSKSASDDTPNRLPFEPGQARKKSVSKAATPPLLKAPNQSTSAKPATAIPQVISRRMGRRMAFFCGIPTMLGMLTLIISYIIITNHWYKLPNVAVLLVNLGFFGLGVLGLSYGALSASWDEERLGSWLGWGEFTTNFARLTESWRSVKQKPDT